ncbi:hypothetical protein SCLCIDRAFT_83705, partial [Scleroderma citrinum Foug A]
PFIHPIELRNNMGETIHIQALFDDGAMTGAMCTTVFRTIQHCLKGWRPLSQKLRMADRTVTPAEAEWAGDIQIAGIKIHGSFLVFNRSGSWAFLFGKPLLTAFKAVHDYRDDTIII